MFEQFYDELRRFVPEDARIMTCQFRGDPNDDNRGKWRARVLNYADAVDDSANVYVCVSAMRRNSRGEFRRRKENFAGGLCLMIDDIGEGAGAKFPRAILDPLQPTALIETSPDNFQAVYMFDSLIDDMDEFDSLIRAFIQEQFLAEDTGMAGVNRVFRPPVGINGKEKYKRDGKVWKVQLAAFEPGNRYSVKRIAEAFGLKLQKANRPPKDLGILLAAKPDRIRFFIAVRQALRSAGMLKTEASDYSGWIHVHCPWTDNHTGEVDNGAAIRLPEVENDWHGAFRCHHGGCQGKGWRELTDWLSKEQAEVLSMVNENAPETWRFPHG
jgi:hypothetical protein